MNTTVHQHESSCNSAKRELLHAIARQKTECTLAVRKLADLAGWLRRRCPDLWALGVTDVRQCWRDPHPVTVGGAGLVLALQRAGLMRLEVVQQQLQPFEQLEGLRQQLRQTVGDAVEFGNASKCLHEQARRVARETPSDEWQGRKTALRERRARFIAGCGARQELQRFGACRGSKGDLGAPAASAPGAKAARGRKGKQRAHKDPDRTGGRTGRTAPKTGNPGPKVSDPE
jgi:hypothetical protein